MNDRMLTRKAMLRRSVLAGLTGIAGMLGMPQMAYARDDKHSGSSANNYFDDGKGNKVNGTAIRNGDHISGLTDDYTGEQVSFTRCVTYADGSPMADSYIDGVIYRKKGQEYFKREFSKHVIPAWFGVKSNNEPVKQDALNAWLSVCVLFSLPVYFPAGRYCLPVDFEYDFNTHDLLLTGDGASRTIITTYDGTPATNFAVPEKIDLTKGIAGKEGVYQIDIIGNIHDDSKKLHSTRLDGYIVIENGKPRSLSLREVKELGFITELDTNLPDPGIDGLYVVARHEYMLGGGAFEHFSLPYNNHVKFLQGTILKRCNGTWSRHYTGAGFMGTGNFSVSNIAFENIQFYLFSPFSCKAIPPEADKFNISDCKFTHCSRVLSLMSYAGSESEPNWFKGLSYLPIDGHLRFDSFNISHCDFSYIHTSIMWCSPPSREFTITNNNIHDCYTIITCIYIFPPMNHPIIPYDVFDDKMTVTISNNNFIRIRTCNPAADHALHVVRVIGRGSITNNNFIDITKIAIYVCGRYYKITNNTIIHYICDNPGIYKEYSSIISKFIVKEGEILIGDNTIINPLGSMLAVEQAGCFRIVKNIFLGYCRRRYVTSETAIVSKEKVYTIKNLPKFILLIGSAHYDNNLAAGDAVYYNSRENKWTRLLFSAIGTVSFFSKFNSFNAPWEYVIATDNTIEIDELSGLSARTPIQFNSMIFERNNISFLRYVHIGNNSIINQYIFSNNIVTDSQFNSGSLDEKTIYCLIQNITVSGNTFIMGPESLYDFRALGLIMFANNTFVQDKLLSQGELGSDYHMSQPANNYAVNLYGGEGAVLIVKNNLFNSPVSRKGCVFVSEMDRICIDNNTFDLNLSFSSENERDCIYIETGEIEPSVEFINNKIEPQKNKVNTVIRFDNKPSYISSVLTNNNIAGHPEAITFAMSGIKTVRTLYKGKDFYTALPGNVQVLQTIEK